MGLTRNDIIRSKARPCSCGKLPIWVKPGPGSIVLGCPYHPACGGALVRRATLGEAIEAWNEEVQKNGDTNGKRH